MLFDDAPIQLPDAELRLLSDWCPSSQAEHWFEQLVAQTPWGQPSVHLHGRDYPVPRLVAWYGDPEAFYTYSGLTHAPLPWTPLLAEIRARVEAAAGQRFNGVLLNYYRDGQDSMGWHSDDEPEMGRNPLVASLNLGGARRFDLRRKGRNTIEHSIELSGGSLLVMSGATQHYWQHQVAKTRRPVAPRLNLTFRLVHALP